MEVIEGIMCYKTQELSKDQSVSVPTVLTQSQIYSNDNS